jgi:translation initiation factor 2B subunit (eIF-2B alpha/beta/delta family)
MEGHVERLEGLADSGIARSVKSIADNIHAGAVEIADQAANVLLRCARTSEAETREAFRQEVLAVGSALIQSQPAMAPLVNLVNAVLWSVKTGETLTALRATVERVANEFKQRLRLHETAIAESMLPFITEGAYVLTNSRSTTVRAALLHAQRAGRRFRVLCAESRPGYEGRTMAAELAEQGISVTLVVDALAISWATRAQLILVGADHLTVSGLVNKAGTASLALIAQTSGIPVYALCSSEKFLPPGYLPPPQARRPAEQVWTEAPAGVSIENYYFDRTPLSHISGIVTERGVLTSAGIEGWLASIQLHPALSVKREP